MKNNLIENTTPLETLAVSSRDAARALGISERTLWSHTKCGNIPHIRLGRRILYPLNELRDWMRRTMSGGKSSGAPLA